ncbi:hypothetical protein FOMPIDRAFT_1052279 [Fomitopsis schrenkii]|uniref:F-box domain-containing protein n=1 Tax=Fomitopsis schrenkii TaxID=2126942 RepID=S8F775_FOMSC|nr:hypothetical protein FOMPIDRAFT_1052279 [Fomitopsis schrenkii]
MGFNVDSTRTVPESFISQDVDHKDALQRDRFAFKEVNGISKLPQELWDIAVAYLSDDAKYLKSCSLTCKALRGPSRKLLWRRLRLLTSARLESLLSEHGDVAAFVHTLSIQLPLAKLPRLLGFKNLKSLTWSNVNDRDEEHNNGIPDNTPPFPQGLSFPGVTDLTVSWYDAPQNALFLHLVACFPNVAFLGISLYGMDGGNVGPQKEALQNIPLSLPCLESLDFKCFSLATALPRILSATDDSLKCIKIKLYQEFDEATAKLLDFSTFTNLTYLEVHLNTDPLYQDWGDPLAASLSHINSSHRYLTHIILHVPSLGPDLHTGRREAWDSPGERLGHELSRVMDEAPQVVVTFLQSGSVSSRAARDAHENLGYNLEKDFPSLTTFPERLRFAWNMLRWRMEDGPFRTHNKALIQDWRL